MNANDFFVVGDLVEWNEEPSKSYRELGFEMGEVYKVVGVDHTFVHLTPPKPSAIMTMQKVSKMYATRLKLATGDVFPDMHYLERKFFSE